MIVLRGPMIVLRGPMIVLRGPMIVLRGPVRNQRVRIGQGKGKDVNQPESGGQMPIKPTKLSQAPE
jgi:hypothetical protein